jgi:hypothetical protein
LRGDGANLGNFGTLENRGVTALTGIVLCAGNLLGLPGHDIDRSHLIENIDITWRDGPTRSNSCIITACQKRCGAQRNQRRASTSHSLAGAAPIADAYHTDPTKILKLLNRERGIRPTMPQAKPDNNNCD